MSHTSSYEYDSFIFTPTNEISKHRQNTRKKQNHLILSWFIEQIGKEDFLVVSNPVKNNLIYLQLKVILKSRFFINMFFRQYPLNAVLHSSKVHENIITKILVSDTGWNLSKIEK